VKPQKTPETSAYSQLLATDTCTMSAAPVVTTLIALVLEEQAAHVAFAVYTFTILCRDHSIPLCALLFSIIVS